MNIIDALKRMSPVDAITITACLHHCAVLNHEDRAAFQKEYGMKADNNITKLIQELMETHHARTL